MQRARDCQNKYICPRLYVDVAGALERARARVYQAVCWPVEPRVNPVQFKFLDGCAPTLGAIWQRWQRRSKRTKAHLVASRDDGPRFRVCLLCAPASGRAPVPAAPPPAVPSTSERGARKHARLRVCGGGLRACERGCACVALTDGRRPDGCPAGSGVAGLGARRVSLPVDARAVGW